MRADFEASAAFGAFGLVNNVNDILGAAYGLNRTVFEANLAGLALVGVYIERNERFTDTGRATLLVDMRFIFIPEILDSAENRIRRRLAQSAQGSISGCLAYFLQKFDVTWPALSCTNPSQYLDHLLDARTAGYTFTAFMEWCP